MKHLHSLSKLKMPLVARLTSRAVLATGIGLSVMPRAMRLTTRTVMTTGISMSMMPRAK
jgi:hypothetical protein